MGKTQTLEAIQQQLGALSQQQRDQLFTALDSFRHEPSTQAEPPAAPRSREHLHPRAEFNGEQSKMAELLVMHFWTQVNLAHIYQWDCESVPRVSELVGEDMARGCHNGMQSVAEMVFTLPEHIEGHKKNVFAKSQLDVLIACVANYMHKVSTATVLNSLLNMGPLGQILAHEIFRESVATLMAPDTRSKPNTARKKALNLIGDRIQDAFVPVGLLKMCQEKEQPLIPNPLLSKNKASATFCYPSHQDELPF